MIVNLGKNWDAPFILERDCVIHVKSRPPPLLRPQTKFAKVMFSQVSVCPQGGVCPIACWDTHTPRDQRQTTSGQTPHGQTPPQADIPLARHPQVDTPLRSACWDTVNKRAFHIYLECILVVNLNWSLSLHGGEISIYTKM